MKKAALLLLCCLLAAAVSGCGGNTAVPQPSYGAVAIGNPWSDHATLAEAENAVGFSLGLPETLGDGCTANVFRTMNGTLLEVVYRHAGEELCIRKQAGEGQDISGDYNTYDSCTEAPLSDGTVTRCCCTATGAVKLLITTPGYSWSLVAPNGLTPEAEQAFLAALGAR